MKLVIQIPCRDEEESLPTALAELPRVVSGFDTVEWILVDDGSVDRSVELARQGGVD
ncbi:MAG TPA: glycosyltransferase, partial [Vicinamibacteria bacterium]